MSLPGLLGFLASSPLSPLQRWFYLFSSLLLPSPRALPAPAVLGAFELRRAGTMAVFLPAVSPLLGRALGTHSISGAVCRARD